MMDVIANRLAVVGTLVMGLAAIVGCVILHLLAAHDSGALCQLAAMCAGALAALSWPPKHDPPAVGPRPPAGGSL